MPPTSLLEPIVMNNRGSFILGTSVRYYNESLLSKTRWISFQEKFNIMVIGKIIDKKCKQIPENLLFMQISGRSQEISSLLELYGINDFHLELHGR